MNLFSLRTAFILFGFAVMSGMFYVSSFILPPIGMTFSYLYPTFLYKLLLSLKILYLVILIWLFIRNIVPNYYMLANNFIFSVFNVWVGLTAFWAFTWDNALSFLLLYYTTILFAMYLAIRCSYRELFMLLKVLFLIGAGVTIAAMVIVPSLAFDGNYGWLQGMSGNRNSLAIFLAIGLLLLLFQFFSDRSLLSLVICVVFLFLLSLTKNTTQIIALFLTLGLIPMWASMRRATSVIQYFILLFTFLILCFAFYILFQYLDELFGLFGKDATLSGRSYVWNGAYSAIMKNPFVGYGPGMLVVSLDGYVYPFYRLADYLNYDESSGEFSHSHNVYLDIWLRFGIIGLFLFVLLVLQYIRKALTVLRNNNYMRYWNISLLCLIIMGGITEPNLFSFPLTLILFVYFLLRNEGAPYQVKA